VCAAQEVLVLQVQVALGAADEVDVRAMNGRVDALTAGKQTAGTMNQDISQYGACTATDSSKCIAWLRIL
jgi:hypothetical protein